MKVAKVVSALVVLAAIYVSYKLTYDVGVIDGKSHAKPSPSPSPSLPCSVTLEGGADERELEVGEFYSLFAVISVVIKDCLHNLSVDVNTNAENAVWNSDVKSRIPIDKLTEELNVVKFAPLNKGPGFVTINVTAPGNHPSLLNFNFTAFQYPHSPCTLDNPGEVATIQGYNGRKKNATLGLALRGDCEPGQPATLQWNLPPGIQVSHSFSADTNISQIEQDPLFSTGGQQITVTLLKYAQSGVVGVTLTLNGQAMEVLLANVDSMGRAWCHIMGTETPPEKISTSAGQMVPYYPQGRFRFSDQCLPDEKGNISVLTPQGTLSTPSLLLGMQSIQFWQLFYGNHNFTLNVTENAKPGKIIITFKPGEGNRSQVTVAGLTLTGYCHVNNSFAVQRLSGRYADTIKVNVGGIQFNGCKVSELIFMVFNMPTNAVMQPALLAGGHNRSVWERVFAQSNYSFFVGKDVSSGLVRVTSITRPTNSTALIANFTWKKSPAPSGYCHVNNSFAVQRLAGRYADTIKVNVSGIQFNGCDMSELIFMVFNMPTNAVMQPALLAGGHNRSVWERVFAQSNYSFFVGKDVSSGLIRVTSITRPTNSTALIANFTREKTPSCVMPTMTGPTGELLLPCWEGALNPCLNPIYSSVKILFNASNDTAMRVISSCINGCRFAPRDQQPNVTGIDVDMQKKDGEGNS